MKIALIYEKILTVYKTTSLPSVYFHIAALFVHADQFVAFFQQQLATTGTLLSRRLLPYHEITLRIIDTAIIFSAFFGLFHDNILAALGAGYTDLSNKAWYYGIPGIQDMPGICRVVRI